VPPDRRPARPLALLLAVLAMTLSVVVLASPDLPVRAGLALDAVLLASVLVLVLLGRRR
jgi:hypothetical protein